ncbi:MAG: HEAT repeat domain-containing protein [Elusimicrobia bacterium]|nr:HEAT repeat domain-containing protein [Elusimicrobiota bacterium]
MIALTLALLLAFPAAAQPDEHERLLRDGSWNQRIHAATELGALGPEALPLLRFAARDADWQVRMTAAHEMGRLGLPALGALETVLREEPCRHVRLTAVHWLGSMGPEASDTLHRALSDESGMVRLMGRYWLKKDEAKDAPPESWEAAAASNEDLKACESSPEPGRAPWAEASAAGAGAAQAPLHEKIMTKNPVAAKPPEALPAPPAPAERMKLDRASLKELDEVLAASERKPELSSASYASTGRAAAPLSGVRRPKDPATPELLPPGRAGFGERPAPETSGAGIAADKGTGKMAGDPLPVLLAYLKDADAAKRARAADELGRRAAAEAVPALTACLKDRAPRVRASAALALGNIGAPSDAAVPAIVAALKKGPEEVSWSAALALGRIGTPRARAAFERSLR